MPEFLANAIDNPLRHKIQPPEQTPLRHGIEPGMTVLEVGPGNGTYTMATARRLGDKGKLVAIDIEPKMIDRVKRRIEKEGLKNIDAQVADVYDLPFENGYFDVIYMITVISEIPDPIRAMKECYRVLSPSGTLVFSELLFDPDYPRASTLVRMAETANFQLRTKIGKIVYYTLIFEKKEST
jgi:ubiquinone/menaquinone biosynthesis C-methylase UbiE